MVERVSEGIDFGPFVHRWQRLRTGELLIVPPDHSGDLKRLLNPPGTVVLADLGENRFMLLDIREGTNRCDYVEPSMFLVCVLPLGHDGPHVGQSKETRREAEIEVARMAVVGSGSIEQTVARWRAELDNVKDTD